MSRRVPLIAPIARGKSHAHRAAASAVALLSFGAILVACGDEDASPESSRAQLPERVQRTLPTHQYALAEEVCPEPLGMPPQQEARTKRRGDRQLRALIDAYQRNPDALVTSSYSAADEPPGIRHEVITIRELLETHLDTADELAADDDQWSACFEGVATALRNARESM